MNKKLKIMKKKLSSNYEADYYFEAWLYTHPPYIHNTLAETLQEAFTAGRNYEIGNREKFKCKCGKLGKYMADGVCLYGIYCPECAKEAIDNA
jgi:hypothetical protein